MPNSYFTDKKGRVGKIVTRAKRGEPEDPVAARERARYVERRMRQSKESDNPFIRHQHQIMMAEIASRKRNRGCLPILMLMLLFMASLFLVGCFPSAHVPGAASTPTYAVMPSPTLHTTRNAIPAVSSEPTITAAATYCVVSTGYARGTVNVRGGPGMNFPVVDVVSEGDRLIFTGQQKSGWSQVKTPSHTGWFYIERWCK